MATPFTTRPARPSGAPTPSNHALYAGPLAPARGPQRAGLLARVADAFRALGGSPRVTTEAGVAGSASPAFTGVLTRQARELGRRREIVDLWDLYTTDVRFRAAVEKHVAKAAANGFTLSVKAREGATEAQAKRAQREAEAMLRRTGLIRRDGRPNAAILAKLLRHGRMEADLFVQNVVAWDQTAGEEGGRRSGEIVRLLVMPSASMERLSDDTDQFPDPSRAFVQVDVSTQAPVLNADGSPAYFPAWQIGHHRWKRLGEDRYGQFEYAGARGASTRLEALEKAQEVRRCSNAARIEDHTFGQPGDAPSDKEMDDYRKAIGVLDRAAEVSADPYHQLGKYVHNGEVAIKVHASDPSVHEIGDLNYFLDKLGAACGTPIQLFGQNLAGMTRDTLELLAAEWLDGMSYDVAWVHDVLLEAICLQLELKGISPDAFDVSLAAPRRAFESAAEAIAFVNKCMTNTLGAGMNAKPYPLLTPEAAVAILAEYLGVGDAKTYVADLEAMLAEKRMDAETVHGMQAAGADPGVQSGATNSRSGAGGGPPTGGGERFEGGKLKAGVKGPAGGDAYRKKP